MKGIMNKVQVLLLVAATLVIQLNGAAKLSGSAKALQAQQEALANKKAREMKAEQRKIDQAQKEKNKIADQLAQNQITQETADKRMDAADDKIEAAQENLSYISRIGAGLSGAYASAAGMARSAYETAVSPFRGYTEEQMSDAQSTVANIPAAIDMIQNDIKQMTASHKENMKTLKTATAKRNATNTYKTALAEMNQQVADLKEDLKQARIITGARYSNLKRAAYAAGAAGLAAGAGYAGYKYGLSPERKAALGAGYEYYVGAPAEYVGKNVNAYMPEMPTRASVTNRLQGYKTNVQTGLERTRAQRAARAARMAEGGE